MSNYNSNFWDERYSVDEYVYGIKPNKFFGKQIQKIIPAGKLLLPGEGEGRNAVHAAKLGWYVDAFDQSKVARKKAMNLAEANNVIINYSISNLEKFIPKKNYYDCVGIIYVHLQRGSRSKFYNKLMHSLKPGGKVLLELFSKKQFGKKSGGPQNIDLLSSIEEIQNDFSELKTILLIEKTISLNEGENHFGNASVVRFIGEK